MLEGEFVEFKRELCKGLLKTVVAFANSKGGTIYVGIDDDGTVLGLEDAEATLLALTNALRDSIKPSPSSVIQCEVIEREGKRLVGIKVERGTKRPYYLAAKGLRPEGVYVRQGAASYMASEAEVVAMLRESEGTSFERGRSLDQEPTFDHAEAAFAERAVEFGEAQMRSLGLVDEDGQFTNLGRLISDQCPPIIKLASFFGTKRTTFKDRLETSGSLLHQLDQALDFLATHTHYKTEFVNMRRVDREDFPSDAVREALLNAVAHRDYAIQPPTLVSVLEDRLEVTSPGGLPRGCSYEEFQMDVSMPRNPKLAAALYRLGLIEAYGTGIARMFEAYEEGGSAPAFHITTNVFKVVLPNRNMTEADELGAIADNGRSLSTDEQMVLAMVREDGPLKRRAIQERFDLSQATLLRLLKRLEEKGLISAEGNTRRRVYVARP